MKKCSRCNIEKPLTEFYKLKHGKLGREAGCKDCKSKYKKERYLKNRDEILKKSKKFVKENPKIIKERNRKAYLKNREQRIKDAKKWKLENRDKVNAAARRRQTKKRKEDNLYKLKTYLRSRMSFVIRTKGFDKTKSSLESLGCTWEELKVYLESKFTKGMTWDNYGKWHVDHIKPLATAKTEEDIYKLNHYTNLQPLWAFDNLSKGSKYDETI